MQSYIKKKCRELGIYSCSTPLFYAVLHQNYKTYSRELGCSTPLFYAVLHPIINYLATNIFVISKFSRVISAKNSFVSDIQLFNSSL